MKPTFARHSCLQATIAAAASRFLAVILAAILLGITAFPTRADCNPSDRIDARCYSDLQSATAAAIAANVPLWLPAGVYTLDRELVIDYAPLAATGFQIISDGAIIDATPPASARSRSNAAAAHRKTQRAAFTSTSRGHSSLMPILGRLPFVSASTTTRTRTTRQRSTT